MKILLLSFVLILSIQTIYTQDNIKVVNFFLLEVLPISTEEKQTIKVPEGVVWRVESALCELGALHVSLIINDHRFSR